MHVRNSTLRFTEAEVSKGEQGWCHWQSIIIITLQGAIWDFQQSPHCAVNRLQHVDSSGLGTILCKSCATHWALIMCNSCYVPSGTKGQLLSFAELKLHLFELYFIGWTINHWRRGGNWSTRRKPPATSFRKCHILKPENSSPTWDSNPHNSIGGRLGKQTC